MCNNKKTITFKVFRFNKETDYLPYYNKFEIEVTKYDVILDIMNKIKWEIDGSFSYRRSCGHGSCGSCAIKINGKVTLACKENVFYLVNIFGSELILEPQDIKKAYKDMVIDKKEFWNKYEQIKPFLIKNQNLDTENIIHKNENTKIDDSDSCIQCGNCYYACPSVEVNEDFLGPSALLKIWRFNADNRDYGKLERLDIANKASKGVWDCVKCNECIQSCPQDLSPIDKITKIHNQIFETNVSNKNSSSRHAIGYKKSILKHGLANKNEINRHSKGFFGVLKDIPKTMNMFRKGKIVLPWKRPRSKNLDEIQKLIKISSRLNNEVQ